MAGEDRRRTLATDGDRRRTLATDADGAPRGPLAVLSARWSVAWRAEKKPRYSAADVGRGTCPRFSHTRSTSRSAVRGDPLSAADGARDRRQAVRGRVAGRAPRSAERAPYLCPGSDFFRTRLLLLDSCFTRSAA